jgi:hypothetical protein
MKYVAEEILGYEEGQIVPPVLIKKIGIMNVLYKMAKHLWKAIMELVGIKLS